MTTQKEYSMNNQKTIVIFGLPGAGKTTLINEFISKNKNFIRLSGGSLIKSDLAEQERDKLRKQSTSKIILDQETLINTFLQKKRELHDCNIIFDGHCMIKDGEKIVEIPADVIKRLEPDKLIFIDTDPIIILERRNQDTSRPDREKETLEQIKKTRDLQITLCQNYSKEIGVKLEVLSFPDYKSISEILNRV